MKSFLLIFSFFLLYFNPVNAQKKLPATLLWRISGKNLQQPSYLFGTMHIREERMFYFGDSVYQAIDNVALFATEIEDDLYLDYLGNQLIENAKLENAVTEKSPVESFADTVKTQNNLQPEVNKNEAKLKLKEYIEYIKESAKKIKPGNQKLMPFIIDAYLNAIAKEKKKRIAGLEDAEDYTDLMDIVEQKSKRNISRLDLLKINNGAMEGFYRSQDLNGIQHLIETVFSKEALHYLMHKRNIKMTYRIDSILQNTTGFFAVGSGHLPGDSGLIRLLRQKGYSVDPVFSSKKIAPKTFDVSNEVWNTAFSLDSTCFVEMPKKSYRIIFDELEGCLHFTQDIGSRVSYFFMENMRKNNGTSSAEIKKELKEILAEKGYEISETRMVKGTNHYEFKATIDESVFRIKGFADRYNTYFLIAGTEERDEIYLKEPDVERFLNSYKIKENSTANKQWSYFHKKEFSFRAFLPESKRQYVKNSDKNTNAAFTIIATDRLTENLYKIVAYKTNPGYYYAKDTAFFNEYYSTLSFKNDSEYSIDTLHFLLQGNPAMQYTEWENNKIKKRHWVITASNKLYYLSAIANKDTSGFANFFSRVQLDAIQTNQWQMQSIASDAVLVYAPKTFVLDSDNETPDQKNDEWVSKDFLSYDSISAINYYVYKKKINPFKTYGNDSIFFEENIQNYFDYKDSVVYRKTTGNAENILVEVLFKKNGTISQFAKYKFFTNGDTLYGLNVICNKIYLETAAVDSFFNAFQINVKKPNTYKKDKSVALLQALENGNYAEIVLAHAAIENIIITNNNKEKLYNAVLKTYRSDTLKYSSAHRELVQLLTDHCDSSLVRFITTQYAKAKNDTVRAGLLYILAGAKTEDAYTVLQKLLKIGLPKKWDDYSIVFSLQDTIALTAKYLSGTLPGLLTQHSGTFLALSVLDKMIDSSYIDASVYIPYTKQIISSGKELYQKLKKGEPDYESDFNALFYALAIINNDEAIKLLNEFGKLEALQYKFGVLKATVKTGLPVNKKMLQALCASDAYRLDVFLFLKEHPEKIYETKQYATQEQLARAYLYNFAVNDLESSIETIKFYSRELKKIGDSYFYFYEFLVKIDGEENYRAAYCGFFNKDNKDIFVKSDPFCFIDLDKFFDSKTMKKDFDNWFAMEFQ